MSYPTPSYQKNYPTNVNNNNIPNNNNFPINNFPINNVPPQHGVLRSEHTEFDDNNDYNYNNNYSNNYNNHNNHNYPPINHQLQPNHVNERSDDIKPDHDLEKDASRGIHIHTPKKPKLVSKDPVKWYRNTREILLAVRSNILLIFLPPAIIMKRFNVDDNILLVFNFLAIIPLSKIMTTGIDDLSARLHPSYGAILHAFAGNFVELVISAYALMDRQYSIVRSSVLGAILCNILLVLGIVFLAGSWPRKKSNRESMNAHLNTQLFVSTSASTLALAVLALVTPAAFKIAAPVGTGIECDLQNISHAIAIILLFVYVGLLVFQLKTHSMSTIALNEIHHREPKYFLLFDVFLIVGSISGIVVCARYLVTSIEHMAHSFRLGNGFIGMVLLPLCVVSNFMEHYDAIKEASEDKIDTAVGLILNTSVQIALLVTPVLVLFGWITSRPLTLDFNTLEICVLACAVLIVNYLVADGKANWLEGYMLIVSYVIIAVAFFYFPNVPELKEAVVLKCSPFSRNLPPEDFGINTGSGGDGH